MLFIRVESQYCMYKAYFVLGFAVPGKRHVVREECKDRSRLRKYELSCMQENKEKEMHSSIRPESSIHLR